MTTLQQAPSATETSQPRIYNQVFWLSYAANASAVAANALTFRFAELVKFLEGNEVRTGSIVSAGVVGALAMRLVLGQSIDRFGVRRLWVGASLLVIASCMMFAFTRTLGWQLYAARLMFDLSLAVVFTCSIVHIQNQVPPRMRTEVIASLGSSGFVGMICGALLGDAIFRFWPNGDMRYRVLFGAAAGLAVLYSIFAFLATRRDVHVRPHETPWAPELLRRHWPGMVVAVAMMMGVWFTVFSVFLTRFATHLGLNGIGTFFIGYCVSAFVFRLLCRNWDRTLGRHGMILIGLTANATGCLMLTLVSKQWHFLIPACTCGLGHALLFPAVISLGAGKFPREYRGTGTTLVLGFTEVGRLVFAPILGALIDGVGYTAMFVTVTSSMVVTGVTYFFTAARQPDVDHEPAVDESALDGLDEEEDQPVALPFPHLGRNA